MEVFAGFVTHADAQIGRFLDFLTERGVIDNTLILALSDNGASAEGSQIGTVNEPNAWVGQVEGVETALRHLDELGGHRAFNHYPWGWAWAGNTPLQIVEALRLARRRAHAARRALARSHRGAR